MWMHVKHTSVRKNKKKNSFLVLICKLTQKLQNMKSKDKHNMNQTTVQYIHTRSRGSHCKIKRAKYLHDLSIKQYHIADIWLSCTTGTNMEPDNHKIFKTSNSSVTVSVILNWILKAPSFVFYAITTTGSAEILEIKSQNRGKNRSTSGDSNSK